MRRKLFTLVLAISVLVLPGTGQASDCGYYGGSFAAGFAFGFLIPLFTAVAVEAATRPTYYYPYPACYYDCPPRPLPPPDPAPAPAPAPARELRRSPAAPSSSSSIGEVSIAQEGGDPARVEAEKLLRQGDFYKASEAYRVLARERPADTEIALRFAESLFAVGNYRYAEHCLRRALRAGVPPESIQGIMPAARLVERRAALEKRLPLDSSGTGRLLAAHAALSAADRAGAMAQLRSLLEASPGDLEALRLAGGAVSGDRPRSSSVADLKSSK